MLDTQRTSLALVLSCSAHRLGAVQKQQWGCEAAKTASFASLLLDFLWPLSDRFIDVPCSV